MPNRPVPHNVKPRIACSVLLAASSHTRPPIICIHGSANAAAVWALWQQALAAHGWPTYALDLRGHGHSSAMDLSHTSMTDYADDVRSLIRS
jgi:pimeloyl-ACP methyl ester carboxylesterase